MEGRELDVKVAEALGLELVGLVPAYRDPEGGGWCVGSRDDDMQPAYVRHCDCDIRNDLIIEGNEDDPWLAQSYKGHMLCCLDVVPFYKEDIAEAMMLFDWLAARGLVRLCNGDGDSKDCDFCPTASIWPEEKELQIAHVTADMWSEVICKTFLTAKEIVCPT